MQYTLRVTLEPASEQTTPDTLSELSMQLAEMLSDAIHQAGGEFFIHGIPGTGYRAPGDVPGLEMIVALGSAGVFTAVLQTIQQFLYKNKEREITLEREGKKVTKISIKGHGLSEEKELLKELLPELALPDTKK